MNYETLSFVIPRSGRGQALDQVEGKLSGLARGSRNTDKFWIPAGVYPALDAGLEWQKKSFVIQSQ